MILPNIWKVIKIHGSSHHQPVVNGGCISHNTINITGGGLALHSALTGSDFIATIATGHWWTDIVQDENRVGDGSYPLVN